MYRVVIFYFSGTGNTWWVADKIKKQFDKRNINADIVSIDSVDSKKADWWIKTADLVFFGWPVYGSDLPEPMKRFVDGLFVVEKGKHIHTFCTQGAFSGNGAWCYHKNFKKKGLIIDSAAHFFMPSNQGAFHEKKAAKVLKQCEEQIERYVEKFLMGEYRIRGRHAGLPGLLQRAPYRLFYKRRQNDLSVDEAKCTRCGLCQKLCPSANIQMDDYPAFGGYCSLCRRCYTFCPVGAIALRGRLPLKKPYAVPDKRFKPGLLR